MPVPEEGVLSPELQDFVLQCMHKDPFRRPTAEGLLSHNFILKVSFLSAVCEEALAGRWYNLSISC